MRNKMQPILWNITTYLDNEALSKLVLPDLWELISIFSIDQHWWHKRVETLLSHHLLSHPGLWNDAYRRIESRRDVFSSSICVRALIEIEYKFSALGPLPLTEALLAENLECVRLLLANGAKLRREVYELLFFECVQKKC